MTALRTFACSLASVAVMAPWPLLGILLLHAQFDRSSEAVLFFGGITLFPLMMLAFFGSASEEILVIAVALVWLGAAVLPTLVFRKRLTSWAWIGGLLGLQTLFAFLQAAMGAMLIIGKSVWCFVGPTELRVIGRPSHA